MVQMGFQSKQCEYAETILSAFVCLMLFSRGKKVRKGRRKEKLNVHADRKKNQQNFPSLFSKNGNLENSERNDCCTWKEKI